MKKQSFFLLLLLLCTIASCTEHYEFPDMGGQTVIVITGLVTNESGPY